MTKLLSKNDVIKVLNMNDTIEILEKAFEDLSNGNAIMPQRTPITAPDYNGLSLFMPAYLKGMGALGAKVVTVYKDNPSKFDLPTVLGTIIILDEKTGAPIALNGRRIFNRDAYRRSSRFSNKTFSKGRFKSACLVRKRAVWQ
jgi:alanine dehydrogenase